jgi:hypothetical protein
VNDAVDDERPAEDDSEPAADDVVAISPDEPETA